MGRGCDWKILKWEDIFGGEWKIFKNKTGLLCSRGVHHLNSPFSVEKIKKNLLKAFLKKKQQLKPTPSPIPHPAIFFKTFPLFPMFTIRNKSAHKQNFPTNYNHLLQPPLTNIVHCFPPKSLSTKLLFLARAIFVRAKGATTLVTFDNKYVCEREGGSSSVNV